MDQLGKRTILIVEDEADIREILSELLTPTGYRVLTAENGVKALEILESEEVEAILSDISMPEMTGLELLSKLKLDQSDIPVVMLTAFGDKANIKEALRLGALDFIEKPFDETTVVEVVNKALEIGVRRKEVSQISSKEGTGDDNVNRVFDLQEKRRMIGLLTAKHNSDRKKKNG